MKELKLLIENNRDLDLNEDLYDYSNSRALDVAIEYKNNDAIVYLIDRGITKHCITKHCITKHTINSKVVDDYLKKKKIPTKYRLSDNFNIDTFGFCFVDC